MVGIKDQPVLEAVLENVALLPDGAEIPRIIAFLRKGVMWAESIILT